MMRARNVYMAALWLRNLSTIEFARQHGMSAPNLRQKVNGRETIRATELFQILGMLDIDCEFTIRSDGAEKGYTPIYLPAKDVNIREIFKDIIAQKGVSAYEASRRLGLNEQSMTQKIMQRGTIKANEFFDVMDVLGVDCIFYDGITKERLSDKIEGHEQAAGVSGGKWYRTSNATLVASSFSTDGVNQYGPDGKAIDMYVDAEGYYFVVEYTKGEKSKISSVPVHVAQAIIEKYGINAGPV